MGRTSCCGRRSWWQGCRAPAATTSRNSSRACATRWTTSPATCTDSTCTGAWTVYEKNIEFDTIISICNLTAHQDSIENSVCHQTKHTGRSKKDTHTHTHTHTHTRGSFAWIFPAPCPNIDHEEERLQHHTLVLVKLQKKKRKTFPFACFTATTLRWATKWETTSVGRRGSTESTLTPSHTLTSSPSTELSPRSSPSTGNAFEIFVTKLCTLKGKKQWLWRIFIACIWWVFPRQEIPPKPVQQRLVPVPATVVQWLEEIRVLWCPTSTQRKPHRYSHLRNLSIIENDGHSFSPVCCSPQVTLDALLHRRSRGLCTVSGGGGGEGSHADAHPVLGKVQKCEHMSVPVSWRKASSSFQKMIVHCHGFRYARMQPPMPQLPQPRISLQNLKCDIAQSETQRNITTQAPHHKLDSSKFFAPHLPGRSVRGPTYKVGFQCCTEFSSPAQSRRCQQSFYLFHGTFCSTK